MRDTIATGVEETNGPAVVEVPVEGAESWETEKTHASTSVLPSPDASPEHSIDGHDGGTRAWLQVLGSFLVFSNLWGFTFAFGTFQSYYELTYLPSSSPSDISWIGTLSSFLLIVGGIVSGPLFDLGYFRSMLLVGATVETVAVFMTSLCSRYWQLLLAQGVLIGLGSSLLYLPGLALVGRSFRRHRAIAMGIVSCGAPVGGIVYTLLFQQLISSRGFGGTVRIMACVMLATYAISFPLLLWGVRNLGDTSTSVDRRLFDPTALRDLPWLAYSSSNCFIFIGYTVPFFYMATYGQVVLGMSRDLSLYVTMIAQAVSIVGRLCAGFAASRIGVMIPWIVCALSSGVLSVAWLGCRSVGSFIAFAALYGCFSGALIPLPPSVFPIVCPDRNVLGTRMGMAQAISSVASLVGSPIAGALSQVGDRNSNAPYIGLQLFVGLALITGAANLAMLWALLVKQRQTRKLV